MATGASDIRAGGAYIEVGPDLKRLQSSLQQAKSKLDKFAGNISSVFMKLATVGGLGVMGRSVVRAAANLEKAEVRFSAAFGRMGDATRGWIKQMSEASGLGEGTLMGMMADASALGRNLGFAEDQAAEMSKTVARLSADLAAHFGDDVADVASRMQMALMGSSRSMREYNISVTEQAARAELMQRGMIGANEAMSEQQKVLGRLYGLIRQTSDAHGTATGATTTFALAVMRLKEMWTDLKEVIGQPMLEIFRPIMQGITGVLKQMRDWVGANPEIVQGFARLASYIVGAIATIKTAIGGAFLFAVHRLTGVTDHFRKTLVWAGNKIQSNFGDALGVMYDKSLTISDRIADVFRAMGAAILAQMKVFAVQFVAFLKSETMADVQNTTYGALRSMGRAGVKYGFGVVGYMASGKTMDWFDSLFPEQAVGGGGVNPATTERIKRLQAQADTAFGGVQKSARDLFGELGWDFGKEGPNGGRPKPPPPGDMGPAPGLPGEPTERPSLPAGGVGSFMGMRRASEMMGFGKPDVEKEQLDTQKSMLGVLRSIRDQGPAGAVLA